MAILRQSPYRLRGPSAASAFPLKPSWQDIVAGTRLAFMRHKSW
jgi:hypothetical protein